MGFTVPHYQLYHSSCLAKNQYKRLISLHLMHSVLVAYGSDIWRQIKIYVVLQCWPPGGRIKSCSEFPGQSPAGNGSCPVMFIPKIRTNTICYVNKFSKEFIAESVQPHHQPRSLVLKASVNTNIGETFRTIAYLQNKKREQLLPFFLSNPKPLSPDFR